MEKLDVSGTEDRPINTSTGDLFNLNDKFVEPVCNYIGNNSEGAMTIAVSGEWGSGKSSAINLLKERLKGYELLLMSALPTDRKPIAGKIYLAIVNERLKYIVETPKGDIAQGYLDLNIPELMAEPLALCKADILAGKIERDYLDTNMFELTTEALKPHKAAILAELSKKGLIRSMEKAPHNGRNIIVNFDPFLEQKLEVPQLITLFFKELERSINDEDINIALNELFNIMIELGLDIATLTHPWAKIFKRPVKFLIQLFGSKKNLGFSEKAAEIGKKISKKGYKVFVFIDEIDRLPSNYIINFLLFCRTLDAFEGLVCIIGLDYKRVLDKLEKEPGACCGNQRGAQDYLDKFFQVKYQILHSAEEKIEYANKVIEKANLSDIFSNFREDARFDPFFKKIIYYLSTPRMIKKFVMTVQSKKAFLENSSGIIDYKLFQFIAATIKSPIILDVLSKEILPEAYEYEEGLILNSRLYVTNQIKDAPKKDRSYIQLIEKHFKLAIKNEEGERLDCIVLDEKTLDFIKASNSLPLFILSIYVSGYEDHPIVETIRIVGNGSSAERNNVLERLTLPDNSNLFWTISSYINLRTKYNSMQPADIRTLNDLFEKKIQKAVVSNWSWSGGIIYYFLKLIPIDEVISKGSLVLSSLYIDLILAVYCGPENFGGSLSNLVERMEKASPDKIFEYFREPGMEEVQFEGEKIVNLDGLNAKNMIKNMIRMWLEKEAKHDHRQDAEHKYLSAQAEKYRDMLKEKVYDHPVLNDNNTAGAVMEP